MAEFAREYLAPKANRSKVARAWGYKYIQNARREVKRFLATHPNFLTLINENAPATNEGERATTCEDGQHNQSNPTSTDAGVIGTQEAA